MMIKILVVDDDNMTRFYLKKLILKKFGFHVSEAVNGLEALTAIENELPNVVFLDISMPVMNGIECLREIRRNPKYEKLSVVIMTAHNDKETVNELFQLGIQDYILKPFGHFKTFERLREILSEVQKKAKENPTQKQESTPVISKPKLLIADQDQEFRRFVSQLLSNRFKVIEASNEENCYKVTQNTNPHVILLSEEIIDSGKVNVVNNLRKTETNHKLKIYLCSSSDKVGQYSFFDGTIKKSFLTDVFMYEFSRIVLKYDSMYSMLTHKFDTFIKQEVTTSVIKSLELKEGKKVNLQKTFDPKSINDKDFCKIELFADKENFHFDIGVVGTDRDSSKLVNLMKETMVSEEFDEHKHLRFIVNAIAERLKITFEKFGVKTTIGKPKVKNIFLNSFQNDWKMIIPIKISDGEEFIVGLNIVKTVSEKYQQVKQI